MGVPESVYLFGGTAGFFYIWCTSNPANPDDPGILIIPVYGIFLIVCYAYVATVALSWPIFLIPWAVGAFGGLVVILWDRYFRGF